MLHSSIFFARFYGLRLKMSIIPLTPQLLTFFGSDSFAEFHTFIMIFIEIVSDRN